MSKARDLANAADVLDDVSATELGYVNGVTSAIQTQIDSKIGSASAINPTIVDAKGDIIAATAADTVARLAVGSNDQVLTADSSTATGLKWATPSAGGMTLISETVASALSSLSFSSIAGTYKQLLLIWSGCYASDTSSNFGIRLNNSSASDYECAYTTVTNTAVDGGQAVYTSFLTSTTILPFVYRNNYTVLRAASQGYCLIDNYASTTKVKKVQITFSGVDAVTGDFNYGSINGVFDDTTAVTSIDIFRNAGTGTFSNVTNSSIRLYGIS